MKLFVYGTLKTGMCRNAVLSSDSELLSGEASVNGFLVDLGSFPGLFKCEDHVVQGELWEINDETLKSLDWIEGHPNFFERRPIKELSTDEEVITYYYNSVEFDPIGSNLTYNWDDEKGVTTSWN